MIVLLVAFFISIQTVHLIPSSCRRLVLISEKKELCTELKALAGPKAEAKEYIYNYG